MRSPPSASGLALGAPFADLARGLATVAGAERRFQRLGERAGVTVIDDYAHHPTEITATLAAARSAFPERRIIIAFQPTCSRGRAILRASSDRRLAQADAVYLTEIYPARECPIEGFSSTLVADALAAAVASRLARAPSLRRRKRAGGERCLGRRRAHGRSRRRHQDGPRAARTTRRTAISMAEARR